MPASQSKITFDALNIVRADNIYLTEPKKDVKRKNTATTDEIIHQKKKLVSDLDLRTVNQKLTTKHKKSLNSKCNEGKTKNTSSIVTAAKKSRKRQLDIGNAYSKLNSQVRNPPKHLEVSPKTVLSEKTDSPSSFYETPRQDVSSCGIDFENINPNSLLPENFYECELDEFIRSQYPDFEDSSEYDFQEPLILENFDLPQETFHPKGSSLRHFKELLDREESSKNKLLEKSEIDLLKDIVKADERYQKLKKDDYQLLKEILVGQLKEISEQERVIKIALEKIQFGKKPQKVKVDTLKVAKAEKPLEKNIQRSKSSEKFPLAISDSIKRKTDVENNAVSAQEVDVFFKNVPSLEREIRILKLLGLKLEETLKKSNEKEKIKRPLILLRGQCVYFKHSISIASSRMFSFASKTILGLVQEFKISHQTINELKLERDFYIATDLNNFTLQRTNFDMLRHNPELLLRRLKPFTKGSRLKFNFIEQDPLFFNHFLANICKISAKSFDTHETFIPKNNTSIVTNPKSKMIPALAMSGAGDHCGDFILKEEDVQKLEIPVVMQKSSRTIIRRNKFKQRYRTPLPEKKFVSAKNCFLKTILLGWLHLTIVLMVFMAILYPDVICL